jgi:hypothetical protein
MSPWASALSSRLRPSPRRPKSRWPRPPPLPLPPPRPLRPAGHTGCNGGQHDGPLAISDGTRAAPVNLRPPQQLQRQRNRGAVCSQTPDCAVRRTRELHNEPVGLCTVSGGPTNAAPLYFCLVEIAAHAAPLQISSSICHFSVMVAAQALPRLVFRIFSCVLSRQIRPSGRSLLRFRHIAMVARPMLPPLDGTW